MPLKARFAASGPLVDAETANYEVTRWLRDVANVRSHGELKERPYDRFLDEREQLSPYQGTLVRLSTPKLSVPTPVASLQHPLSTYDALVGER